MGNSSLESKDQMKNGENGDNPLRQPYEEFPGYFRRDPAPTRLFIDAEFIEKFTADTTPAFKHSIQTLYKTGIGNPSLRFVETLPSSESSFSSILLSKSSKSK